MTSKYNVGRITYTVFSGKAAGVIRNTLYEIRGAVAC